MHQSIFGIKLRKHYELKATNNSLLGQLQLLHDLVDLVLAQSQFIEVSIIYVRGAYPFVLEQFFEGAKVIVGPNEFDFDQVHERLELVTRLLNAKIDALLVSSEVVVVHDFQEGPAQAHALVRRQDDELGEQDFLRLALGFAFKDTSITNNLVIHVAHKIMPVGVVRINETRAINIELEHCLKTPIDLLEIV